MKNILSNIGERLVNLAFEKKQPKKSTSVYPQIVDKSIAQSRKDIRDWKHAVSMAKSAEFPRRYPLINLFENDILEDAHLTSQIENRKNDAVSATFELKKPDGNIDEDLTQELQNAEWLGDIIEAVLDTHYFGYSLVELDRN